MNIQVLLDYLYSKLATGNISAPVQLTMSDIGPSLNGGPPLSYGASLVADGLPVKGGLRFPEGIDLEMIDSLTPLKNTQFVLE